MAAQEASMMQTPNESTQWKTLLLDYNRLTEDCFIDCVHDFTSKKANKTELTCTKNCLQKQFKVIQRIAQRIHEFQWTKVEGMEALTAQR